MTDVEKESKKVNKGTTKSTFRLSNINKSKIKFPLQVFFILLLIISGIVGWNNTRGAINLIEKNEAVAKEASRPANLEITTITDKTCTDCSSLDGYIKFLKQQNVKIVKEINLDLTDSEAQSLIKKYNIQKLPFFTVSGELQKDAELAKIWSNWGVINNNVFVLANIIPPYLDLATKEVNGLVNITYITDDSCEECFDVKTNKNILEGNYGVKIVKEDTFDISSKEGKEFQEKYNITKIPTFILNNEVSVYQGLLSVWNNVGSIESDGMYLFKSVEQLGVYYDLDKKEVVDPASKSNADQNNNK